MSQINVEVSYKANNKDKVSEHDTMIKDIASKFLGKQVGKDWEPNNVHDVEFSFPTIEKARKFLREAYNKKLIEHDTLDD